MISCFICRRGKSLFILLSFSLHCLLCDISKEIRLDLLRLYLKFHELPEEYWVTLMFISRLSNPSSLLGILEIKSLTNMHNIFSFSLMSLCYHSTVAESMFSLEVRKVTSLCFCFEFSEVYFNHTSKSLSPNFNFIFSEPYRIKFHTESLLMLIWSDNCWLKLNVTAYRNGRHRNQRKLNSRLSSRWFREIYQSTSRLI